MIGLGQDTLFEPVESRESVLKLSCVERDLAVQRLALRSMILATSWGEKVSKARAYLPCFGPGKTYRHTSITVCRATLYDCYSRAVRKYRQGRTQGLGVGIGYVEYVRRPLPNPSGCRIVAGSEAWSLVRRSLLQVDMVAYKCAIVLQRLDDEAKCISEF